jgi:hypothetical protein
MPASVLLFELTYERQNVCHEAEQHWVPSTYSGVIAMDQIPANLQQSLLTNIIPFVS